MEPPEEFADGFTWKTVVGAVFLGFLGFRNAKIAELRSIWGWMAK
mgnify:CR=1 FL=1